MEIELKLEEDCTNCDSRGFNYGTPIKKKSSLSTTATYTVYPEVKCTECGGKGTTLTELGEKLILFVKRWS